MSALHFLRGHLPLYRLGLRKNSFDPRSFALREREHLNAIAAGRSTPRTLTFLSDGTVLNDRTRQKIRAGERGAAAAEAKLVTLGATPRDPNINPAEWLTQALQEIGATRMKHPGNHRYLMLTGKTPRDRNQVRIGLDPTPYPKRT